MRDHSSSTINNVTRSRIFQLSMFWRPIARSPWHLSRPLIRQLSCSISRHSQVFPTISSSTSPTCKCAETPTMPEGLEIDRSKRLNGTIAGYAEHVLICTGQNDWASRIEEENSGDNLAADVKELMGRGGVYSDPFHNVLLTNASFPSSVPQRSEVQTTSAYILPSFKYIPFLPRVSFDSVQALVKGYLLPKKLNPAHDNISPIHKDRLLRSEEQQEFLYGVQTVKDILVLICGHGGRDLRCGIMGPVLRDEFESCLPLKNVVVLKEPVKIVPESQQMTLSTPDPKDPVRTARVGLISHIGGHKFAGNVILYIPPHMKGVNGKSHALAGCGIWYGRVEPKHVESIVQDTILNGTIIEDLFRGGINRGGEILRL